MCIATRDVMDGMFEAYLDASLDPDDIPKVDDYVWILGSRYHCKHDLQLIRRVISSKIWITYRKNFVPIGGEGGLTSDKGWGCMLRCGQMVLAQALIFLEFGREWLWEPKSRDSRYLKIIHKFEDTKKAPYSIHQIALMGESEGKHVGEWFGPNTVAQVLKKLQKYDDSNLRIHVALDSMIIISDIKDPNCPCSDESKSSWTPLLLIVPLRLGLNNINPIYFPSLTKCFKIKQSLGIIGGTPNHALYFIAVVDREVIYLDPHTTQESGFVQDKLTHANAEVDSSYHIKFASRMHMSHMDPSIAVCFLCPTEAEFYDLCKFIKDDIVKDESQPLFEISYDKPKEWFPSESSEDRELARNFDSDHEFEIL